MIVMLPDKSSAWRERLAHRLELAWALRSSGLGLLGDGRLVVAACAS